jgi:hypothetical protein
MAVSNIMGRGGVRLMMIITYCSGALRVWGAAAGERVTQDGGTGSKIA